MSEHELNQYTPDLVSPPGDTLAETLAALGMTQAELAARTGRPHKTISEIINGKASITPETALQLERVLGVPARFWLKREQQYQEWRVRQQEEERLHGEQDWLAQLPVAELVHLGWIQAAADPIDQMRELLHFFAVASPEQWRRMWLAPKTAFRHRPAFASDAGALAAWLRKGQLDAQAVDCAPYNAAEFKSVLRQVRALTVRPANAVLADVRRLCATAGVAFVVVPALAGSRVSAATEWLTPSKAMLLLSLRYRRDGQFWFSFFHAAAHILLHGKRGIFLDDGEVGEEGTGQDQVSGMPQGDARPVEEREADTFAAELLVPSYLTAAAPARPPARPR